jgi:3'(2'), 5'-bisphosphate nucleotidase
VLSEEAPDDLGRLTADRVWIIDPLDGSREYAEPGRSDWAVHVALWERGDLTAGAVALPAFEPGPPRPPGRARIVVSRTRPPDIAAQVADSINAVLVPMGSAGAKAMAVVRGEADAYLHAGGMHEWDSAAPVFVARAAGLHASRLDGRPLRYNQPDPWLPDLLICRPELAGVLG